jgi:hypothetical protein
MEVYRKIKKDIKEDLISKGEISLAKKVYKIIDTYLECLLKALFENGEAAVKHRVAKLYVSVKPIAFINHLMYKNMLVSSYNSNYLFEIKLKADKWRKHGFTFKSMKLLKYKFFKECLNTDLVNNLISKHEKSII